MASVKVVMRKKRNQDGTYPLALRITKDRKTTYIYLGKSIEGKDWDATNQKVKRNLTNHNRINNFLVKKRTDAERMILEHEVQDKKFSVAELKKNLTSSQIESTFFAQAKTYFVYLEESGNYNRLTAEKPAVNHFKRFLKGREIAFSEISISMLESFHAYLIGGLKVSARTAANYLIILRALYKRAIKNGIVDQENYPFGHDKFHIKKPESLKIGLSRKEVKSLEKLELDHQTFDHHARNLWLFSFYFAGMRVSDVVQVRWSDFRDGRIFYVMGKNKKAGSLPIAAKALAILEEYECQKSSNKYAPHEHPI